MMTLNNPDNEYLQLMLDIQTNGCKKPDRTGTGTTSSFARQMRFDLTDNKIPLLTTKKMFHKGIIHELLWFLSGSTNIEYLKEHGVNIWNEWADEHGDLGPVYGAMWRAWPSTSGQPVDQIADVIQQLKESPDSRRIIINAWNPGLLPDVTKSFSENVKNGKQALPPCHAFIQFWCDNDKNLSCHLYQRSADIFLGVPFNIAQYSILTHMIAHVTGLYAKEFIWTGGDVHIYNNHTEQCNKQLANGAFESPQIHLSEHCGEIDDFEFDDFVLLNYEHHDAIKAPVSI